MSSTCGGGMFPWVCDLVSISVSVGGTHVFNPISFAIYLVV